MDSGLIYGEQRVKHCYYCDREIDGKYIQIGDEDFICSDAVVCEEPVRRPSKDDFVKQRELSGKLRLKRDQTKNKVKAK